MIINGCKIATGQPPYIIAEMSGNHNQSLEQAIQIADAAKRAGVSALKLQAYTADSLTIPCDTADFRIDNADSLWQGENLYDLYQRAHTPWDLLRAITDYCATINLDCFSSAFDETAVDYLEDMNSCAYKIASFENGHIPLIRKAASTGKPLIISTGMATEDEITEAVDNAREAGCTDLALLKCTSNYPADPADSNLISIPHLAAKYNCIAGLSDHTLGIGVPIASIGLGGCIIEKHFTTSRDQESVDSAFSADETEMKALVEGANIAALARGKVQLGCTVNEAPSVQFRRSIYAVADIKKGAAFTPENVRVIRPGFGLHPRHYTELLHCKADQDYAYGARIVASALQA